MEESLAYIMLEQCYDRAGCLATTVVHTLLGCIRVSMCYVCVCGSVKQSLT